MLAKATITLSLLLSLTACGPAEPPQKPVAQKDFSNFEAVFSTAKASFAKDATVPLKLEIKNTGDKPTELRWASAKTHDFTIRNAKGEVVWTWSVDKIFAQAFTAKTVGPGAKLRFHANWNQQTDKKKPVLAGIYSAEADFGAIDNSFKIGPIGFKILESRSSRR